MRTRYETVIWDWNGTLLNDVILALSVVNEILWDFGLDTLTFERYREIFDFPVQVYYERAGVNFSNASFEEVSGRYCRAFEDRIDTVDLFLDARSALSTINEFGLRKLLLSSTEHEALCRMVSKFGITSAFQAIRGMPDGLARGKAHVGRGIVAQNNLSPENTVLVGDTYHDWEVAQHLGMDCVLVSIGHQSAERLSVRVVRCFTPSGMLSIT